MSDAMDEVFGRRNNRPDHRDFWTLSEVVLSMDAGFDETKDDEAKQQLWKERTSNVADIDSVIYMASQRVMRMMGPPPTVTHARHQAQFAILWVDAFVAGAMFERGRHEPGKRPTGAEPLSDEDGPPAGDPIRTGGDRAGVVASNAALGVEQPVLLVWGDPHEGFRFVGPVVPNDPELDRFVDQELRATEWWYVPLRTLEEAWEGAGD